MRNRYLPRSSGGSFRQPGAAVRAASTARATSFSPANATSASGSSFAGLIVWTRVPSPGATNSPPMNSSYWSRSDAASRDSGAGA
jgi:hypothetical protein